ncbi:hypothetical protein WVIC16_130129 [Weissella viridescens]|nr:hypothetical protein WVIC16_130129 [Weissella viridescens]
MANAFKMFENKSSLSVYALKKDKNHFLLNNQTDFRYFFFP